MVAGADGFVKGVFKDSSKADLKTDIPNLLLSNPLKRPAAAPGGSVMKKPSIAEKKPAASRNTLVGGELYYSEDEEGEESEEESSNGDAVEDFECEGGEEEEPKEEDDEEPEPLEVNGAYMKMYYGNGNFVGIRRKMPDPGKKVGTQIFSFGGKFCGKSQEQLREIGDRVLRKLNVDGMSEADALAWAKKAASE